MISGRTVLRGQADCSRSSSIQFFHAVQKSLNRDETACAVITLQGLKNSSQAAVGLQLSIS